jgi:hypothetical protein
MRRSARSTGVERALRARFRLWIQSCDKSGSSRLNFSQLLQGRGAVGSLRGMVGFPLRWTTPAMARGHGIPSSAEEGML